ncbi:MAG TPA: helix-turn-helix transcriptional regulator [Candidatus Limnocylindrales bacterium]
MDDQRAGLAIRAMRRRLGWTQQMLARRTRIRQQELSDIERGRLDGSRVATIRRVASVLGARLSLDLLWRGGALDRLLDERHSRLVERAAEVLVACGWEVRPEVSFAVFGERGSIDLLAWHETSRALLMIEVKTVLASLEEMLRRFDVKVRLAPAIVADLLGWRPTTVGNLLILPETTSARRRVADHPTLFAARFPDPGRAVRGWLAKPIGSLSAIWYLPIVPTVGAMRSTGGAERVRVPKTLRMPPASR